MNIGIIGYGGVGKALVRLLNMQKEILDAEGLSIKVSYVVDYYGGIHAAEGIDLAALEAFTEKEKDITKFSGGSAEITVADMVSDLAYHKLAALAKSCGVQLGIGCTTGGALPSVNAGMIDMAGSSISSIEGVLNGTTNFILKYMEDHHCEYEQALKIAQECGIAETNPTLDVEGWDTAGKLLILTNVLMGEEKTLADIKVSGITSLTAADIESAAAAGLKYKLVGKTVNKDGQLQMSVGLERLPAEHLLYSVEGKNKAVRYVSDTLGELAVIGGASGVIPAAASILRDIVNIHREYQFIR